MQPSSYTLDLPSTPACAGHRVALHVWENPNAIATVICAHGLTRNGRDFDYLARVLCKNFRVICPDIAGRGSSEWLADPAAYNYPHYVTDMIAMLDQLNLSKVHWIGTSMGGIIGMMLTAAAPGRLQSLALNDIGCLIPAAGLKRIMGYVGKRTNFATRTEAEAELRAICAPYGIHKEEHWQHLFAHSIEDTNNGRVCLRYDPAIAVNRTTDEVKDVDLWPLWATASALPVLLIRGAESDILLAETAQEMQAKHPSMTLYEIAGAGHAPPLMSEEQTGTIEGWINSVAQA